MRSVLGGLAFLTLALLTSARVEDCQSNQTIWADAVIHAPSKPRPWVNLGIALMEINPEASESAFLRAEVLARLRSGWEAGHGVDLAYANRAVLRMREGQQDAAKRLLISVSEPKGGLPISYGLCREWQFCTP